MSEAETIAAKGEKMNARRLTDGRDPGNDLRITHLTRRPAAGGTWVGGRIAGHRFEALVFPGHADHAEWELGQSRISKLWVRREHGSVVYEWDWGPVIAPADARAAAVVDFLAAGLAEHVLGS